MTNKNNNTEKVDKAWKLLYNRLEKDGLLPEKKVTEDKRLLKPSFYKWTALAAAACICAIVVLITSRISSSEDSINLTLVNNESDANLVTTLEDGSIVYLAQQAALSFPEHFGGEKREVILEGEAFFDINKHESKPFIVETELVSVEVLGTAFNIVSTKESPFSLSVLRGKVRVVNKKDGKTMFVESGQSVFLNDEKMQTSDAIDFSMFDVYMGNLHFKDEKLSNIVRVINSNSDSIKIALSPQLEERLLTVSFKDETVSGMAELICLGLDLQYKQEKNTIIISRK